MSALPDIDLISQSQSAASLLDPIRLRLLGSLREPDSAAGLARRLGLPRQKANYHLRALEEAGLVEVVEERRKGKVMERILRATATHYLICPSVLGPIAADSAQVADQFSCAYLIAATARTLSEVALLREKAQAEGKELATLSMQVDVSFPGPAERKAFTEELMEAIAGLVAKHHDSSGANSRSFRYRLSAYPAVDLEDEPEPTEETA